MEAWRFVFHFTAPPPPFNGVPSLLLYPLWHQIFVSLDSFSSFSLSVSLWSPAHPCHSRYVPVMMLPVKDAPVKFPPHWQGEFARRAAVNTYSCRRQWNIAAHLSLNMFGMHHINTFFTNFKLLPKHHLLNNFLTFAVPLLPTSTPTPLLFLLGTNYCFPVVTH